MSTAALRMDLEENKVLCANQGNQQRNQLLLRKERIEKNDLDLDDVIFSDESSVQLEHHRKTSYHKIGQPCHLCGKPKHPVKVYVWGGISC